MELLPVFAFTAISGYGDWIADSSRSKLLPRIESLDGHAADSADH
jgi:hypothetical protein